MTPHEHLTLEIAEAATGKAVKHAVRGLQRLTDGLQSGDDSGLTNAWDEICVQVQGEASVLWGAFERTARATVSQSLNRLSPQELSAIWLQTEAGEQWASGEGESSPPGYCLDDVTDHVMAELLEFAGRYSNNRIRAYSDH